MGEDGKCHKLCYISARGYMLLENIWLREFILFSLDCTGSNVSALHYIHLYRIEELCCVVLHGWGKMGHILNGVLSNLGGICFKRIYS